MAHALPEPDDFFLSHKIPDLGTKAAIDDMKHREHATLGIFPYRG